jgi:hypothetical protein
MRTRTSKRGRKVQEHNECGNCRYLPLCIFHINVIAHNQSVWMRSVFLTCTYCGFSAFPQSGPWNFGPTRAV